MESRNPVLNQNIFTQAGSYDRADNMSIQGVAIKTGILLSILVASSFISVAFLAHSPSLLIPALLGSIIVTLILGFVLSRNVSWAPVIAPIYAACDGILVGLITLMYHAMYNGIVFQAISLTIGVLFVMMGLYGTGVIKVTDRLAAGISSCVGAIMLTYVLTLILGLFGVQVPFIHSAGPVGIAFSLFVVGVAAFTLLLDFEMICQGERSGSPKYMEWYGGFALLVTLVWLYIEILRLLSKLQKR